MNLPPNISGSIFALDIAKITQVAPTIKPFSLSESAYYHRSIFFPHIGGRAYAIESATGTEAASLISAGAESEIPNIIEYTNLLHANETIRTPAICLSGMFISSADCGITSNPTNMDGAINSTATNPDAPVKAGTAYSILPLVMPPKRNISPTKVSPMVAMV